MSILKHLSSVLLQFLSSKQYFRERNQINYKNNCILDGFLVLLKNAKITDFLRNVVMWPTDFMVTVWLSSKSWKIYIRLYSGYYPSSCLSEEKSNHITIKNFKCNSLLLYIHHSKRKGTLIKGLVASLAYSCNKRGLGLKYLKGLYYVFFIFKDILQLNTKSLLKKWKQPDLSELNRLRFWSINTPPPISCRANN